MHPDKGFFYEPINRRRYIKTTLAMGAGLFTQSVWKTEAESGRVSKVFIVKTDNAISGVQSLLGQFGLPDWKGLSIALKSNCNSDDPYPASTAPDTLSVLVEGLQKANPSKITLAERSGMGNTKRVLKALGVADLAQKTGFETVIIDDLKKDGFIPCKPSGTHWKRGFQLVRIFTEADKVVQTCCLKTHRFGGHFTMALKNAVGAVAKFDPEDGYNYMDELHTSPLQRTLIAEISQMFRNDLIVMDGRKAFVTGGPDKGNIVEPGVFIASNDPVAIDAVGVAILRMYGTTREVSEGKVFEQEQLRRAGELGIGVSSPDRIKIIPLDEKTEPFVKQVQDHLV